MLLSREPRPARTWASARIRSADGASGCAAPIVVTCGGGFFGNDALVSAGGGGGGGCSGEAINGSH